MSNLEKIQRIIEHFEITQEHNVYVIRKLKELKQGIINELERTRPKSTKTDLIN